ncbi:hypothetical protein L1999_20305 [Neobacillus drentensis]|uniref:hypothetical protein n=1 Tax=Neobacillus drentensis TaxID=220684 RepID=UPI001F265307|nr:hypothetical protein [Neobacillus drentensis]ULT55427.1 hypothetical protein L1999_20305 [Neobacillus drentensis]
MQGTKAKEDTFFTSKAHSSYVEFRHGQGLVPIITHGRTAHNWENQGGYYLPVSTTLETIEVRARLNPKLRRK